LGISFAPFAHFSKQNRARGATPVRGNGSFRQKLARARAALYQSRPSVA